MSSAECLGCAKVARSADPDLECAVHGPAAAGLRAERAEAQADLCWWKMAGYSHSYRQPFARLAPLELPSILVSEGAALSRGRLPLRPLASFLCETARLYRCELHFEAVVVQLRQLLPHVPDDGEPAAPAAEGGSR